MTFTHPELEFWIPRNIEYWKGSSTYQQQTTIDLIEISPSRTEISQGLDDGQLRARINSKNIFSEDPTRIIIANRLGSVADAKSTAIWLRKRFEISDIFFQAVQDRLRETSGTFIRYEPSGRPSSFDGFYTYIMTSNANNTNRVLVWFSHSLLAEHSTYIIHSMPEKQKEHFLKYFRTAGGSKGWSGRHSVDTLNARVLLLDLQDRFKRSKDTLVKLEQTISEESFASSATSKKTVTEIHTLSKRFHIFRSRVTGVQNFGKFLIETRKKWLELELSGKPPDPLLPPISSSPLWNRSDPVQESLQIILSEANFSGIWVNDAIERCTIQINLLFNILAQADNRTNLDIAKLTSKIAVFTQNDSASMITMAVLTMLFLPGTFVSALFSMVFFEVKPNDSGQEALSASQDWWLFLAVTIPLTILVFLVWVIWRGYRVKSQRQVMTAFDVAETQEDNNSVNTEKTVNAAGVPDDSVGKESLSIASGLDRIRNLGSRRREVETTTPLDANV